MEGWVTFVSAAAATDVVRLPPVVEEVLGFLGLVGRGRDRSRYEGKSQILQRDKWDKERREGLGWGWRFL